MTMLTGRVGETAVAAAMGYRSDEIASDRGRGYASALTRALIDPAAPAVLSPSPEAESPYRRLGFAQVSELRQWQRHLTPEGSVVYAETASGTGRSTAATAASDSTTRGSKCVPAQARSSAIASACDIALR
jgi:hypothetical protein